MPIITDYNNSMGHHEHQCSINLFRDYFEIYSYCHITENILYLFIQLTSHRTFVTCIHILHIVTSKSYFIGFSKKVNIVTYLIKLISQLHTRALEGLPIYVLYKQRKIVDAIYVLGRSKAILIINYSQCMRKNRIGYDRRGHRNNARKLISPLTYHGWI